MYNTRNDIQYSVISHNGKEYKNVYMCVTESLLYKEIGTILFINYTTIKNFQIEMKR